MKFVYYLYYQISIIRKLMLLGIEFMQDRLGAFSSIDLSDYSCKQEWQN